MHTWMKPCADHRIIAPLASYAGVDVRHLDDSSLEARLEALCAKGCRQVRRDIAVLESGAELPETQVLTADERAWMLAELRQIMAVYGDSCRL